MKKNTSMNPNDTVCTRLKELRKQHGMSQEEFAIAFSKFVGRKTYRRSTIGTWETVKMPQKKILKQIAAFYGIPYNHIVVDEKEDTIDLNDAVIADKNSLWKYDHEPVWCLLHKNHGGYDTYGRWGLIDAQAKTIVFSATYNVPFESIDFELYRRPLPFSFPADAISRPLSVKEVALRKKIWIEPIGGDYQTRQFLKSWGTYQKAADSVLCDTGLTYPMQMYGKTFLAFSEPCEYKEQIIK